MVLKVELDIVELPFHEPFVISRQAFKSAPVLRVTLIDRENFRGRGEAHGVSYHGETPDTMAQAIMAMGPSLPGDLTRAALLQMLPPGGARFAMDAALWDLEAKRDGQDPFAITGTSPCPVTTCLTIGMRETEAYFRGAKSRAGASVLKAKVGAENPMPAIEAVRRGAPDARLIIDPNQAWSVEMLKAFEPALVELGVALLEQPIRVGDEPGLDGWMSRIPLCADELIDDTDDLPRAHGRFQFINIKLEKCGGLTAALALADAAKALGFGLMVGCMGGSSLAMAPGMVLAQRCGYVDLDGPLFLVEDIEDGFDYDFGLVRYPHKRLLWG